MEAATRISAYQLKTDSPWFWSLPPNIPIFSSGDLQQRPRISQKRAKVSPLAQKLAETTQVS